MKSAFIRSARVARNAMMDLRFGRPLGGVYLNNPSQGNSDYDALEQIFSGRIRPGEVLVDAGCGNGRVLNYWLRVARGHRLYGIELDETLAVRTQRRLRRRKNVTVIVGDAGTVCPADATLVYLFNPFGAEVLRALCDRVSRSSTPLTPRILYYNPKHLEVLRQDSRWDVDSVQIGRRSVAPYHVLAVAELRR